MQAASLSFMSIHCLARLEHHGIPHIVIIGEGELGALGQNDVVQGVLIVVQGVLIGVVAVEPGAAIHRAGVLHRQVKGKVAGAGHVVDAGFDVLAHKQIQAVLAVAEGIRNIAGHRVGGSIGGQVIDLRVAAVEIERIVPAQEQHRTRGQRDVVQPRIRSVVGGQILINFHTAGICALLTLIGLFFTAVFYTRKMKGAILYGILLTWILGMLCQVTGLYVPTPDAGFYSLFPSWGMTDFSRLGLTFGQCFNVDFSAVGIVNFIVVIFSFLFVDIFDTLGTLIGVATKAKMLDKDGKLPGIKPALMADSIATSAGAILGTSTTTTFVESASGVAVGGRTGLTALVTGILFLVSTLFAPI